MSDDVLSGQCVNNAVVIASMDLHLGNEFVLVCGSNDGVAPGAASAYGHGETLLWLDEAVVRLMAMDDAGQMKYDHHDDEGADGEDGEQRPAAAG